MFTVTTGSADSLAPLVHVITWGIFYCQYDVTATKTMMPYLVGNVYSDALFGWQLRQCHAHHAYTQSCISIHYI